MKTSKVFSRNIGLISLFLFFHIPAVVASLDIPNVPLNTGSGVYPNIIFLLNDSGSMDYLYMPGIGSSNTTYPEKNKLYYNPNITYVPPPQADGSPYPDSDFSNAYVSGYNTSLGKRKIIDDGNVSDNVCVKRGLILCWDYTKAFVYHLNGTPYYVAEDCDGIDNCTSDPRVQKNVANWYSYYRSRLLVTKAAIMWAFSTLDPNTRVGYGATSGNELPPKTSIAPLGDGSPGTRKYELWKWLEKKEAQYGDWYEREALYIAGSYFEKDEPWRENPSDKNSKLISCRQNFVIYSTDGDRGVGEALQEVFSGTRIGNSDGKNGEQYTSTDGKQFGYKAALPFKDDYDNTLADIAMHYWKRDLRPDLPNNVPTNSADPAFWQHMATFTLSLGAQPNEPELKGATVEQIINWGWYGGSSIPGFSWPRTRLLGDRGEVAEVAHAGINGRGGFFAAPDPQSLTQGLQAALSAVYDRVSSSSNIAINLSSISSETLVFQPKYTPGPWTGELLAYPITSTGLGTLTWSASIPSSDSRRIFTSNNSQGVEFKWNSLNETQRSALQTEDRVNYLRGDHSKEIKNKGNFRNRSSLLGDIIHSSPVFVDNKKSGGDRAQTVFVGANDGMLHAFDATNGQEVFAYVPNAVITSTLATLANPGYIHRYFVDGPISVTESKLTPGKNILVGSLGYGGKALFALDVTNPKTFSASNVKWEFSDPNDLGLVIGEFILAKLNNGKTAAIFGNGYNSTNEHAVLFVVDLDTGALIQKIDTGASPSNGLSAVRGWDNDGNGTVDYVYAGDLQGNLWKFDLSNQNANQWDVALKQGNTKQPLFHAQDKNGEAQPITARPSIGTNPADGSLWVFFGTGRYLTTADISDTSTQSWYGIMDDGKNAVTRSQLKQRKIVARGTDPATGNPVRAFEQATPNDMADKKGWYVDLDPGERMITSSQFYGSVLIASSIIPSDDPCIPGGKGYVNAIDPFTGAALGTPFFTDYGTLTVGEQKIPVGSVDLGIGMPGQALIVGDKLVGGGSGGSGGTLGLTSANPGGSGGSGRVNWRELIRE